MCNNATSGCNSALLAVDKILLTATPLQNILLELYGLVSIIDERIFSDADSFRIQFGQANDVYFLASLKNRIAPVRKRKLMFPTPDVFHWRKIYPEQ